MNDTLKVAGRIGAELGAAKAESERLRGLLREVRVLLTNSSYKISGTAAFLSSIDAALSQQAEPECRCTMRQRLVGDGCSVCNPELAAELAADLEDDEQAPAQDEHKVLSAYCKWYRSQHGCAPIHPRGSREADAFAAGVEWATRPAQTEQQPVAVPRCVRDWYNAKAAHVAAVDAYNARLAFVRAHEPFGTSVNPEYQIMEAADREARSLLGPMFTGLTEFLAAPIAQTATQPEQEPFWYAVVSEQAPSINSAIRRLDVAQEFADSKRERWPDTRVVPLYAAPQPEQSGLVEALRTEALGLCDVVEKINSLSPVTYALQAGRAINKVRDAAAALSAQWTAEQ